MSTENHHVGQRHSGPLHDEALLTSSVQGTFDIPMNELAAPVVRLVA